LQNPLCLLRNIRTAAESFPHEQAISSDRACAGSFSHAAARDHPGRLDARRGSPDGDHAVPGVTDMYGMPMHSGMPMHDGLPPHDSRLCFAALVQAPAIVQWHDTR
jgi:hypothetical protein